MVSRQDLCERRLVPTHAFTLGVLCRLTVGAAVEARWAEAADHARRALACMDGLLEKIHGRPIVTSQVVPPAAAGVKSFLISE